jgi:phage host-nuclease inhibitor protein Gam
VAKARLKTKAAAYVSQSRDDVARDIRAIGDLQRDMGREAAAMNDAIAEITAKHQPTIDAIKVRLDALLQDVHGWCEANRTDLTENGKTKTANFITGSVQWRNDPPSVTVRNGDKVLEMLGALGLGCYVRTKKEINKEAILADRTAAESKEAPDKDEAARRLKLLAGLTLTIKAGVEQFVITPLEVDA